MIKVFTLFSFAAIGMFASLLVFITCNAASSKSIISSRGNSAKGQHFSFNAVGNKGGSNEVTCVRVQGNVATLYLTGGKFITVVDKGPGKGVFDLISNVSAVPLNMEACNKVITHGVTYNYVRCGSVTVPR